VRVLTLSITLVDRARLQVSVRFEICYDMGRDQGIRLWFTITFLLSLHLVLLYVGFATCLFPLDGSILFGLEHLFTFFQSLFLFFLTLLVNLLLELGLGIAVNLLLELLHLFLFCALTLKGLLLFDHG
jgi:hypothetical protein